MPKLEIEINDLKVKYGKHLALEIEKLRASGKIISVIGHNGSGKSTLIKTALGLLAPKYGSLKLTNIQNNKKTILIPEKHMAFSPENGAVFEDLNVESYIKLWCRIKLANGRYYLKEGSEIIESLQIAPLLKKLGRELSKGQKRRVQTAVGFLIKPKLFLFDEPFDGLDILQSSELASIIQKHSNNMNMIISSHRMEVIERLSDMVIVLRNGRLHTYGNLDDVCINLCRECFSIQHLPEQQALISEILPLFQREFRDCLINQIGRQLIIAGNDLKFEDIKSFFNNYKIPPHKMDKIRPSLVDAMSYHLNQLH